MPARCVHDFLPHATDWPASPPMQAMDMQLTGPNKTYSLQLALGMLSPLEGVRVSKPHAEPPISIILQLLPPLIKCVIDKAIAHPKPTLAH